MRANRTVNPDFAQVESDREDVNLTRFSLFYPEKREFFLEGQKFFDFEPVSDARPFSSRRIGLAPDRTEVPILVGGRVLGKWGAATLGAMVLQTAEKGAGEEGTPTTNFGVVRWKQDVLEESSVGVLAVSGGHFYAGERRTVPVSGPWKVNKHLTPGGTSSTTGWCLEGKRQGCKRWEGGGLRFYSNTFWSHRRSADNDDEEAIFNFRMNWIPGPGSDLFLVINQQGETWESRWNPTQTTVLTKLVWRMAF